MTLFTILILFLSLSVFESCSLFSGNYEGMEFTTDSIFHELYDSQGNFIDDMGYYFLEAESTDDSLLLRMRFPAYRNEYVFNLPYDNYTEICLCMTNDSLWYTASSAAGNGVIIVDQYPDSLFNELRGNFHCELVNTADESDTLRIESGAFVFIF